MADSITVLSINVMGLRAKLDEITTLARTYRPDFVFLQETNIGTDDLAARLTTKLGLRHSLFSLATQHCGSGVAILQTSDSWTITDKNRDSDGRIATLQIEKDKQKLTLVNIYAPASYKNQPSFYDSLDSLLKTTYNGQSILLGGDFNCVLTNLDIVGGRIEKQIARRINGLHQLDILHNIIETHNLIDAYRNKQTNGKETTHKHFQLNRAGRIDRFYVPSNLKINQIKHIGNTLSFTDHKAVVVTVGATHYNAHHRKSPHWKFNNTLLQNEMYTNTITKLIKSYADNADGQNLHLHWDSLKDAIKEVTVVLATKIKKQRLKEEKSLELAIKVARQVDRYAPVIPSLEEQLEKYKVHTFKGALTRTRLNTITQEIPSKQYLQIEQNIQSSRQIHKITDGEGKTQKDTPNIGQAFRNYYSGLYEEEATDEHIQDDLMQYAKRLEDEDRDKLDTPLTLAELRQAVNGMAKEKSPGPDGLTSEFYQHFFPILGQLLLRVYENSFANNRLPPSLNTSYITLIPKGDADKTQMKNYRPISLLNTDYKVLTKSLTNRLKRYMATLVHEDQQASVPDRNIQKHTHFIRDIISYTHERNSYSSILSLDQEKAFDRVSHSYLIKTLSVNNLGKYFIDWIKIIYSNPDSKILLNHTLTESFKLTRSVRQGCPLSPLLYVLVLEPLLEKIRQDKDIKGTFIPNNKEQKLLAYADDTAFFPSTESSIIKIIETFTYFGKGCGAKINLQKSSIMGIGRWKERHALASGLPVVKEIKIYGITFLNKPNVTHKPTWDKLITKITEMLERFKYKTATIFGRSVIVNTFIIPKIIYIATAFNLPPKIIKEINKLINRFIFRRTIHNIKHTTIIQDKLKGGTALQCITTKIKALRIKHIKQIIEQPAEENTFAHYYLGLRMTQYIKYNNAATHHFGGLPSFYKSCLESLKGNENLLGLVDTKTIYKALVLKQADRLNIRIKWGPLYSVTDFTETFKNIHNINIAPHAREVAYRLIFNMTPVLTDKTWGRGGLKKCKLCGVSADMTETHIFLLCPTVRPARILLRNTIQKHINSPINIFKSITLNIIPHTTTSIMNKSLVALSKYRQLVWSCRNNTIYENRTYTPETFLHIFRQQLNKIFDD
jgi:exonuclease III